MVSARQPAAELSTAAQANFTDDAHGATTDWLGTHQASLFGTLNGSEQAVAVTLFGARLPFRPIRAQIHISVVCMNLVVQTS